MNIETSELKRYGVTRVTKSELPELLGKTVKISYTGRVVNVNRYYIHLKISTQKPKFVVLPYHPKMEVQKK